MGRFLVELYLSKSAERDVAAATSRARAAAAEAEEDDLPIECLRSIFVPEEETWFLLYDAPTTAAVRRAVERAGLKCPRIVDAVAPR